MRIQGFLERISGFLIHIAYLSIIGLLIASGIFKEPNVSSSIFLGAIAIFGILIIALLLSWINKPYNKRFEDENSAIESIRQVLEKSSGFETIRVCGTSCTSIFELFEEFTQAIVDKKRVFVCILNPNEAKTIEHLMEAEANAEEVLIMIKRRLPKIRAKISPGSFDKIDGLINGDDPYGSKVIYASILLWLEARGQALNRLGELSDGLEIYLYSHLPTLKAWIFGEGTIFLGTYGPLPGRVGISNPIHLIRAANRNGKNKINGGRTTIAFLMDHPKTVRVQSLDDLEKKITRA